MKSDSTVLCSIARFSLTGIGRMQLLRGVGITPGSLLNAELQAEQIAVTLPRSRYEFRCDRLHASIADSDLVVDGLRLSPMDDGLSFFAASPFRQTRYALVVPHTEMTGFAYLGLFEGMVRCVHALRVEDPFLDIIIDKDKQVNPNLPPARMPQAMLSSMKESVRIDSVVVRNGRLRYQERFAAGAQCAVLACDSIDLWVEGVGNPAGKADTTTLRLRGLLMNAGVVNLRMVVPVTADGLSFRCSGDVGGLEVSAFNSFLEVSEQKRFKSGVLHAADFEMGVIAGHAQGFVRARYSNLKIVAINGRTGSESGIGDRIVSFLANNVKLRTGNIPDESGAMKVGNVEYRYSPGEAFFEFAWFGLRSGIADVVGF